MRQRAKLLETVHLKLYGFTSPCVYLMTYRLGGDDGRA